MPADIVRVDRLAALPARGNPRNAAEDDEGERLQAAVALEVDRAVFAVMVKLEIVAHEGISDLRGHEFINLKGLIAVILCPGGDLLRERTQIRRKTQVGAAFREILPARRFRPGVQRHIGRGRMQRIGIAHMRHIAVADGKLPVFLQRPAPPYAACGRIGRGNAVGIALQQPDVALLRRLGRERQMHQIFAGNKILVVNIHIRLQRDAALHLSPADHLVDHGIEPFIDGAAALSARAHRAGLDHALVETDKVPLFPVDVNEIHPAGQLQLVKLLRRDVGRQFLQLCKRLFAVPGILRRQAADPLPLAQEAGAQHLRHLARKAHVDRPDCAVQIARPLALEDILRQRHAQRIHTHFNVHICTSVRNSVYYTTKPSAGNSFLSPARHRAQSHAGSPI